MVWVRVISVACGITFAFAQPGFSCEPRSDRVLARPPPSRNNLTALSLPPLCPEGLFPQPLPGYGLKGHPRLRKSEDDTTFMYVAGAQFVDPTTTTGIYGSMDIGSPAVKTAGHSLAEMTVELGQQGKQQIVEVGWVVDTYSVPLEQRLFVFHWINGQPTCYNACGWVQVSSSRSPGMSVVGVSNAPMGIEYYAGNWWIFYQNEAIGYFPESLWGGTNFSSANLVQWFGEVAAVTTPSQIQMGNGVFGSQAGSLLLSNLAYIQGQSQVSATASADVTNPNFYDMGNLKGNSFSFGGPGG